VGYWGRRGTPRNRARSRRRSVPHWINSLVERAALPCQGFLAPHSPRIHLTSRVAISHAPSTSRVVFVLSKQKVVASACVYQIDANYGKSFHEIIITKCNGSSEQAQHTSSKKARRATMSDAHMP